MAQRTYDGPALDGTMEHITERDLDEEAENVDVPQDDQHVGDVSTDFGFLDDDSTSKKEKVQKLWVRSDYDYEERGSLRDFYESEVSPVLDVSEAYCCQAVGELEKSSDEDGEQELTDVDSEDSSDGSTEQMFTRSEIEHNILKPVVFAKRFAEGDEQDALEEAEELIKILLDSKGE
jgi:hypothetical protein